MKLKAKKEERDFIIEITDVEHGHDSLMRKKKNHTQELIPIVSINIIPCIVTSTKLTFISSPSIVGTTGRRRRPSEKRKVSDDNDQGGAPVINTIFQVHECPAMFSDIYKDLY